MKLILKSYLETHIDFFFILIHIVEHLWGALTFYKKYDNPIHIRDVRRLIS